MDFKNQNKISWIQIVGELGLFIAVSSLLFVLAVAVILFLWDSLDGMDLVSMSMLSCFFTFFLMQIKFLSFKYEADY